MPCSSECPVNACNVGVMSATKSFPFRSMLSGACFAAGWALFIDRVAVASMHADADVHPNFIAWIPGIACTVAFALIALTKASDFATREPHEVGTQAATLAIGWALTFAASCMSLMLLMLRYGPNHHRELSSLGAGIVLQTCFIAFASVLTWARETADGSTFDSVPRL